MTKKVSNSTRRRVNPGARKEELTRIVAKHDGDARGETLADELRAMGYNVDIKAGLRAVHFIERHCRHTEGPARGRLFLLRPWQFMIVFTFFGCIREDGRRLFQRLWFEVGKKNGKTELIGAILLYCLVGLGICGSTIYSAAAAQKQANETYKVMNSMRSQDPVLRRMIKPFSSRHVLHCAELETSYETISSDADYNDGARVPVVGVDEVHRHKNRGLYDVLRQGQGPFPERIFIGITTAGAGHEGLAWEEHEYARQVLEGIIEDESLLAFIYSVPEEADWTEERNWYLANPALGDFLDLEDLRQIVAKARSSPSEEHSIRRLRMNQWVSSATRWLDLASYDKCGGIINEEKLRGRRFYGGLDLSHVQDLTAWAKWFPWEDDTGEIGGDVVCTFWMPENAVKQFRPALRPTIEAWIRAGFIRVCPGDVVDHREVLAQVKRDCEIYQVQQIGFDNHHAYPIISELMETLGDEYMADVNQGFAGMNTPAKLFEALIARGRVNHGGNPVLRWMAANAVAETNYADEIRPSKKKSADKIDGIMAMLSALERAMFEEEQPEVAIYMAD